MSVSVPVPQAGVPTTRFRELSRRQFAALAVLFAVVGIASIWPTALHFWGMWTTDALKSIGMLIPLVSSILVLRAWRSLDLRAEGTWWGLIPLLFAILGSQMQERAILLLVISPGWATGLPPPSLILFAYGLGVVLLLGGVRLYRAAMFPIILLWFANPVPHKFSLWVDLPLQRASAVIARAFAMHLGQPLTPDHLRLMFTPEFGMFIAPGCNGIRGALTMGLVALIAGYVYRFRWFTTALVVAGAILLGYIFNLLRLCLLVLYYLVALRFPSLQDKAENADYLIGAALFLVATILLFTVIYRLRDGRDQNAPQSIVIQEATEISAVPRSSRFAQLAVMVAVAFFGCVGFAKAKVTNRLAIASPVGAERQQFPKRLGSYLLERTWDETLVTGPVVYSWAEYAPVGGGTPVAVGFSPVLGWHDPLVCHTIRGERPLWLGNITVTTGDATPVSFTSAFYNDGVTQSLEASTQCSGTSCNEFVTDRTHFGFVYSRVDPRGFLGEDTHRSIPVLIRVETLNLSLPSDAARQQLTQSLRAFLGSVRLADLIRSSSQ